MQNTPSPTEGVSSARQLGAFERMYYRYEQRHTMNFMVAAEFMELITVDRVVSALKAAQRRHPLLRACIEDDAAIGPEFRFPEHAPEVELRVVHLDHRNWNSVAAENFTNKIDNASPTLMRATLVSGGEGSTILLQFSHVIADGMSAIFILEDIVASLNGNALKALPTPPSQEQLIAALLPEIDASILADLPAPSPEMAAWVAFEPEVDKTPHVSTCTLDAELTAKIVSRCRAEETTVQGLLVAAFSQVYSAHRSQDFVRVVTPINFRSLIGERRDSANYITAARTGSTPLDGSSIWDQARALNEELIIPRSNVGVTIGSMAIRHFLPSSASSEMVEGFMNSQLAHEMQVSNLGVLNFARSGPIYPAAVWGPMLLLNIAGEANSGITTFEDRLHIVTSSRVVDKKFLDDVQEILTESV
ncbi:condensation domain-containing protein [Streptomyces sp. NPDC088354]|uniref:condensation domain-containing protein n=1 Tax=Streptomyces sp. NPDC088354 TaxID=3365856 RepID=UPI00381AD80C